MTNTCRGLQRSAANRQGISHCMESGHAVCRNWHIVTFLIITPDKYSFLLTYLQTQYDTGLLRILLTCCYMMLTEHNLLAIDKCLVDIS